MGDMEMRVDLLVIGSGPGGYGAAFRGADLGLDVALVDPRKRPGGVCLHEGCIPSKTYLYLAELLEENKRAAKMGVHYRPPDIHLEEVRAWKEQVVGDMANGLVGLSDARGIQLISALAHFEDSTSARLEGSEISRIRFKKCIVATGSEPVLLPGSVAGPGSRIMTSKEALDLADIPGDMLIVGGGYIGLEIGTIYAALGSRIHLVELENRLLSGVDRDLVAPLQRHLEHLFGRIDLQTRIVELKESEDGLSVRLQKPEGEETLHFDKALVAVGRRPVSDRLGLENTRVNVDQRGFIRTDDGCRTTDENIFAVGDVRGGMMLAHTAIRQGRVAAEAAAGRQAAYDVRAIPAVVYTDPQIAWCGLTEEEAKAGNIAVKVLRYPWKYSGRAATMGATDGLTKILADPRDGRILGVGICGRDTEGLIAEGVLAIEMGALAEDLALSLHPHPTLSETLGEAAEIFLGSPTHILPGKKT
jgi:dihydrolipoamide dehydrogenase